MKQSDSLVRWAILGAGKIAHSFAADFSSVKHASIVAVASKSKNRATMFAEQYQIPNTFLYQQLYDSTEVTAVYIATTHNFHYEQCKQCLLSGKAVLCEKPITINSHQWKELQLIAQHNKVFIMEGMWTYFLPVIIKMQQWIADGRIGQLKVIDACFGFPMEKNLDGRLYNPALAGGALLDLGVYPVALTTLLTRQMPDSITTSGVLAETGVDERLGMVLQYGEVTATLFTSMVNIMNNTAFIYGTGGYIQIPNFFKASYAMLYDDHHNLLETFTDTRTTKGYNFQIQHVNDCLLKGKVESDVVTHALTGITQQVMTTVRQQVGVVYPEEK